MIKMKKWYKSYSLYFEINNSVINNSKLDSFQELRIRRVIEIHDYTIAEILNIKKNK